MSRDVETARAARLGSARRQVFLLALLSAPFLASSQTITLSGGVHKYASLTNTTVNLSGRCELWVTNPAAPLSGCTINLNSAEAWLFLPGVKPSAVVLKYIAQVKANGAVAVADGNVRVVQYGQSGAVVIPQSPAFQPLTVFSEPEFGGTSTQYSSWRYYTGGSIAPFNSFKLQRGYQAVFAQTADGKSYSKCYVAQDGDLEVGVLPAALAGQVQFLYVTPWRWTSKKGIAGNPGIGLLNLLWWYDWNLDQTSSRDLEYVAIRQNQYWPGLSQNWQALGINTLLGYNEPDNASQANLSVSTAISAWGDLLGTGLRVGSPATTDGGRSGWLYPFVQQADAAGLRVDFVAVHYYWAGNPADASGTANLMYGFLLDIWNNTHRPIWITEWNNGANWTDNNPYAPPTYAQQQACLAAMVQMLETTPFVERYALYNWVEDVRSLVTNGVPTLAGVTYSNQVSALGYSQALPDNGTRGRAQYLFATNTLDTSGYANNGMAVGAPTFTSGHNGQAPAIVLDGANSCVQLPANIARSNAFTFAAWVCWNGGANWQRIFDFGNDTSHYLFLTPSSGSQTLRFAINSGNGEQTLETSALALGSWRHVAVTLNGHTALLYLNGSVVAASTNFSIAPSSFSPARNFLGRSQFPADPLFSGRLEQVEIADYALTAAQIQALRTNAPSALPPFTSGIWTNDADGNWSAEINWQGGLVANGGNGIGFSADFSTINLTADRTVTLDGNRALAGLRFGTLSGAHNWTLAGSQPLMLDAPSPFIVVKQNTATISAPLAGTNGFTKSGAGTLVLTAANSYRGTTTVAGGALYVNGSPGPGPVTVSKGTLGGDGVIGGGITVASGGTLAPGGELSTLTAGSVTLEPGSTTVMAIAPSLATNDHLRVTGTLSYGGALVVTNASGTLAPNDRFLLFAARSVSGAFARTNLPALEAGLAWKFDPTNGLLSVVEVVARTPPRIACARTNDSLALSWPADHVGWRLQVQTNAPATGLSTNWLDVANSSLTNRVDLPLVPALGSAFYRLVFP